MDGPAHPLSLKVMRVSRPELASAWQPFYSSSPSFSAYSTASISSLQGKTPLPGYPKTLRDLTHASELLTLPSSFGSIQLGETFSSCLSINNEAHVEIEAVSLKVEMQTASSKVLLAKFGGMNHTIAARETFECLVSHDVKELGQHVLACCVTYRPRPNARLPLAPGENSDDPTIQTIRKFYKFAVTNPLLVKTKVHTPRSPSALLSSTERDKVFFEVHIQNLTQNPIHFESMQFECAEGWVVEDANVINSDRGDDNHSLYSGAMALMQPQDVRQYIYILTPKSPQLIPTTYVPGSVVPLGRLDISWRTSFGEPGRLLTSMLTRRTPIPTKQPVSAIPPYVKRTISRPQSPQLPQSRPGSPPQFPSVIPSRSQSPFQVRALKVPDIEVNLVIRGALRRSVRVEKPFQVPFRIILSAAMLPERSRPRRVVTLALQHIQIPHVSAPSLATPVPLYDTSSPRPPSSGFSTPSSTMSSVNPNLAHQKLLTMPFPTQRISDDVNQDQERVRAFSENLILPSSHFNGLSDSKAGPIDVVFIGSSMLFLPPIELSVPASAGDPATAAQEFELTYLPLQKGFTTVRGLRILLIEDTFIPPLLEGFARNENNCRPRILKEWDIISEVWVTP